MSPTAGVRVRNYYKVLGISCTADDRRIKSAFRRRAKALHPDLNPGDMRAEQRFKELTQAYEVLRNARARDSYDALLAGRRREVRRRFAASATLMVASFMLTMGSAYAVLAWHDAGAPFWESWQPAKSPQHVTAPTTSMAVRTANLTDTSKDVVRSPATPSAARNDGPSVVATVLPPTESPSAVPAFEVARAAVPALPSKREALVAAKVEPQRRGKVDESERVERVKTTYAQQRRKAESETKSQRRLAAAIEVSRRNTTTSERREAGWQWPTADEPFMGLGATNR